MTNFRPGSELDHIPDAGNMAQLSQNDDLNYAVALQRAIEHHCDSKPVPESVAKFCPYHAEMLDANLAQPEREWAGLTEDEKAYSNTDYAGKCAESWQCGVEWAEAKLKEKNK